MSTRFGKVSLRSRIAPWLSGFDGPLALAVFLLCCLGLLTMYSSGHDYGTRFSDHARNMLIAATVMFVVAQVPPQRLMAVAGSSLGGFYATWVAEQTGCKAVLLNPAVQPARDLEKYIGEQTQWHDPAQHFYFRPEFVEELRSLYCPQLHQLDRYLPIIAKGDELLDWREMQARYQGAPMHVLEGGDHALSNFAALLPEVLGFLALPEASLRHNPPL